MIIEVEQVITNLGVERRVVQVYEVADFGITGDRIPISTITAKGQLIVGLGNQQAAVLQPPATTGLALVADLTETLLMKWGSPPGVNTMDLDNEGTDSEAGDVVVDGAASNGFDKTTTEADPNVMGVCAEGILSGATGKVSVAGPVTVKTTGAVTAWHVLISSTTAGYAKDGGASNAYAFAVAVTSSAGGLSTVQAILIPTGARTADTLVDLVKDFNIEVVIGSGLSEISTGVMGFLEVPTDCTIQGWSIVGDQSGSIVIDVWKDTYANFPPTVADTIAGSEKPTLSSAQKNQDLSLSTWTTGLSKGDWLGFNVDSASTVTQVTLSIRCVRA